MSGKLISLLSSIFFTSTYTQLVYPFLPTYNGYRVYSAHAKHANVYCICKMFEGLFSLFHTDFYKSLKKKKNHYQKINIKKNYMMQAYKKQLR